MLGPGVYVSTVLASARHKYIQIQNQLREKGIRCFMQLYLGLYPLTPVAGGDIVT